MYETNMIFLIHVWFLKHYEGILQVSNWGSFFANDSLNKYTLVGGFCDLKV